VLDNHDLEVISSVLKVRQMAAEDIQKWNDGKDLFAGLEKTPDKWKAIIAGVTDFDIGKWMYDIMYSEGDSARVYLKMKLEEMFVSLSVPFHISINDLGCLKISSTLVNLVAVISGLERSMGVIDNVSLTNAICNTEARVVVAERSRGGLFFYNVKKTFSKVETVDTTPSLQEKKQPKRGETKKEPESGEAGEKKHSFTAEELKPLEGVQLQAFGAAAKAFEGVENVKFEKEEKASAPWYDVIDDTQWLSDASDHVDALNIYRKVALTKIKVVLKLHRHFDNVKEEYLIWLFIFRILRLQREIFLGS